MKSIERVWDFDKNEGLASKDLVFDRKKGTIHECAIYNADFKGQYISLPLRVFNRSSEFYIPLNPVDLIEAHAAGQLSGRLAEIASTLDEEDNPVILIAKYKK